MHSETLIPVSKSALVNNALIEAFGATTIDNIRQIDRGRSSALVLRIEVAGGAYLMKIATRRYAMMDPSRQFVCMNASSDAGIAPKVRYFSIEDGISISDFITDVPQPAIDALTRVPAILRQLHALPPFPHVEKGLNTSCIFLLIQGPMLDGFLARFRTGSLLTVAECDQLLACHAEIAAIYPRPEADMVSCHNDLFKPDNILFDGERLWLTDWDTAFLNDRYADLAAAANLLVFSDEDERRYLSAYFGTEPNDYQLARLFLMRQLTHIFYAMAFLGPGATEDSSTMNFREFHQGLWNGDFDLAEASRKAACGRVHLQQLFEDIASPRYRDSLRLVTAKH